MLAAAGGDPASVMVEIGGVLLVLAVAGRLAGRIGLSPIPLYLVAGLFLGEGGALELTASRDFIEIGAQIGVILLLLMLGLEYSARELVTNLAAHRAAGLVDLVLNATPGVATALLLGWGATSAFFLGAITYISSSGIVSKVVTELGRVGNRETPTVLSLLIIEDLAMAVFLPVGAGLLLASGIVETLADIAVASVALVAAFAVAWHWGDRLSRVVFHTSSELLLLTVVGVALLIAGEAEQIHAPSAVAALLVGIALSGAAADTAKVVLTPVRDLFAAVFFVFFGLEVDPSAVVPALPVAAALGVVTAATKIATGAWAARRAGVALPGRIRAGTVLVARGEFSIILAGVALAGGVTTELGSVTAAYVLLMATAGPVLTRFADPIAYALPVRGAGPPMAGT
jgi:CPA2 family monovalent cation:H+ antiporter-2